MHIGFYYSDQEIPRCPRSHQQQAESKADWFLRSLHYHTEIYWSPYHITIIILFATDYNRMAFTRKKMRFSRVRQEMIYKKSTSTSPLVAECNWFCNKTDGIGSIVCIEIIDRICDLFKRGSKHTADQAFSFWVKATTTSLLILRFVCEHLHRDVN